MKRNTFLIILIIVLTISIGNLFGKEPSVKLSFKSENLLMPVKIQISNGQIYFLDKGDETTKAFDRDGMLVKSFGKRGQGPGEVSCIADFCIYKENIYILDTCNGKIEIFSTREGKHVESKKINVPTPFKMAVNNEKIFLSSLAFLKGQKIISTLAAEKGELKVLNSFLDCIPIEGLDVEKIYKNSGVLTTRREKVYFAFTLSNKVLEFSDDGKLLKEYLLPLKSIDKLKIDRKGSQMLLKSALNYDIRAKGDMVYLLSRDEKENSLIFGLEKGRFIEKFRVKERLISFDILEDEIWGIEEEEGEVLIYKVKYDRGY